jgi:predicted MFS family arabinose efflux permease
VNQASHHTRLFTKEFVALNGIVFLSFCNISVFFQFHDYLGTLPIPAESFGFLIAAFSLSVLAIRPLISPFLHPGNAKRWIGISSFLVMVTLLMYSWAHTFTSMTVVRIAHGAAYVVMAAAVLSKIVGIIPREKSGQAFGLLSVITLLPYAVIPPFLGPLIRWTGSFDNVLALSAAIMGLAFPLLLLVDGPRQEEAASAVVKLEFREVATNLKDWRILLLLLLSLLVWTAFTPVFYFLKGYGETAGIENPGWFFTLSTFTEILVRVVAGRLFDRFDKAKLLIVSLASLALGYVLLAHVSGVTVFFGLGLWLGLGWGVAMPLLSGLVFDVSDPRMRALNSNLAMEMFQAGFFIGPVLGGTILLTWGYPAVYQGCAAIVLVGLLATVPLVGRAKRET